MSRSFCINNSASKVRGKASPRSVFVTGAAGRIGSYFAARSWRKYKLRLLVHGDEDPKRIKSLRKFGEVVVGDICDLSQMQRHCKGIDTVVHLAANPSMLAPWDSLLNLNIIGTYYVFTAAKAAKCRRVIFASSVHAVSGYPLDVQVKTNDPVNPGNLYGVSKCFGEALARFMAEQEGLSAIALRIGAFQPNEAARRKDGVHMLGIWVSYRDLNQLIQLCIDDEKLKFAIFNGLSNNLYKRLDISDARELIGYAPKDDLAELNKALKPLRHR